MSRTTSWHTKAIVLLTTVGAVGALGFSNASTERPESLVGGERIGGRLIAIDPLPPAGVLCDWTPPAPGSRSAAALQQGQQSAPAPTGAALAASLRKPLRMIRDPHAAYSSIAVDPIRNEVVVTDENLFQVMVYDRLTNTPPTASFSEPKRTIGGLKTHIEYSCGVYIDPANGDIYSVSNDTTDTMTIFSREAEGDVPPDRELFTPAGTFGIAVDEEAQELYLTTEHDSSIVVYRKGAKENDSPVRLIQGDRTKMADPHGIAIDFKNRLIFVVNHGNAHSKREDGTPARGMRRGGGEPKQNWPKGEQLPGSGRYLPPSITVYPLNAVGDTPPLRVIEGSNSQLNWPAGIAFDPKRNELFVANDMGDSILVFSATASGNAAPTRVIKGPKSLVKNPNGVFVDVKNDELWVANFGNHTATVYSPSAGGDTPPLRVIRSAPLNAPIPVLGNPGAIAYDQKREEILVPN